jgi:hypothetical protein
MNARLFRPALTECEDRLTPAASPAQILADLSIVQMDSAILRSVYNDPSQVTAKGNDQVGHAFMTAIANQSATAVADLTPFVGELQSQIAANPALGGLLGAYVARAQAAIVTADLNADYTQFFQQVISAAAEQHQALANAISAATSSTSSATSPTSSTSSTGTSSTGSQQATVNPNGTITVNGSNGPITLPNPSTSTGTGATTTPSTGSTGTAPTSENTSGSGTTTTNTPPTSSTGTTQTGATSSVSSATGTTDASGTGGNTPT